MNDKSISHVFFINGIIAILGYNSVLSSLDYFNQVYQSFNVFLYFILPCFICATIVSLSFQKFLDWFCMKKMIIVCLMITSGALILLLIISLLVSETDVLSESSGFYLSIFFLLFIGVFCTTLQLCFFSLINSFGEKIVSWFTIGTGVSGLVIILIRALTVGVFGDDPNNKLLIIIYVSISVGLSLIDCFLNHIFVFSTYTYQSAFGRNKKPEMEIV